MKTLELVQNVDFSTTKMWWDCYLMVQVRPAPGPMFPFLKFEIHLIKKKKIKIHTYEESRDSPQDIIGV